jgi:hypothetical protein
MKIEELKDKLDDVTFASLKSYVDELIGQRDVAKRESIDQRKNLKAEVEQLRKVKADLFEKMGLDDDADIDALPDAKGQADAVKQFETKLKRMDRELTDKSRAFDELQGRYRSNLQQVAVQQALRGQEWYDADAAELLLSSKVEWDGDDVFYKTDKGLVPLVDGVKLLTEQKPHLLKAAGTAGSGQRGAGATQATDAETLAKAKAALIQQYSGVNP